MCRGALRSRTGPVREPFANRSFAVEFARTHNPEKLQLARCGARLNKTRVTQNGQEINTRTHAGRGSGGFAGYVLQGLHPCIREMRRSGSGGAHPDAHGVTGTVRDGVLEIGVWAPPALISY